EVPYLLTLVVVQIHRGVAELAGLRRTDPHLAFLINDRVLVGFRRSTKVKDRPAVFLRKHPIQKIMTEAGSQLGFKWINGKLFVVVQKPMGSVPAVFVHRGNHDELEIFFHFSTLIVLNFTVNVLFVQSPSNKCQAIFQIEIKPT
ncbi:MAG: hypothetical protein ACREL1_06910, partial [bacterium]